MGPRLREDDVVFGFQRYSVFWLRNQHLATMQLQQDVFCIYAAKNLIESFFTTWKVALQWRRYSHATCQNSVRNTSPSPQLDVQSANRSGRVAEG
jgi:hypothetical protein